MADLITFNPPVKGTPETMTLNKTELGLLASVSGDAYFSDDTNWKSIIVSFKSTVGNQKPTISFDAQEAAVFVNADLLIPTLARNTYELRYIIIQDFNKGFLKVNIDEIPTAQFDIDVTPITGFGINSMLFPESAYTQDALAVDIDNFTVSVWYQHNTAYSKSGFDTVFSTGTTDGHNINLGFDGSGNFGFFNPVSLGVQGALTGALADGDMHHIVFSSASGVGSSVYLDGVLAGVTLVRFLESIGFGTPIAGGYGVKGWLAQADVFLSTLDATQAGNLYNTGSILDPADYVSVLGVDAVRSYTMGDDGGTDTTSNIRDIKNTTDVTITNNAGVVIVETSTLP